MRSRWRAVTRMSGVLVMVSACVVLVSAAFAASGKTVHFEGAVNNGRTVEPGTLWLSADGTLVVQHVQWSTWGGTTATGRGTAYYHGCTPTCAQAPEHHARVVTKLSRIHVCGKRAWYSTVTLYVRRKGKLRVLFARKTNWAPC